MGGLVSGAIGIGQAVFGGGGSTPSAPNIQVWQPQYTGTADTQAYNSITGINNNNPYAANAGNYQNILNQSLNNPYAAPAQSAANAAGSQYATTGAQGGNTATALNAGVNSLLPYISSVMNTAMDPQSALYNQQFKQLQDQAGVVSAQQGLTGSPYAASVQNNANTNFNIDWQNNQLSRQIAGLQAGGKAIDQAGTGATTAQNLGTAAAGSTTQAGQVPLTAYNQNLTNVQNALNNYGQSTVAGNANTQTAVSDLLSYLGLGAQQSNAQANATQTSYLDQVAAANAQNQGIMSLANSFGNAIPNFVSGFNTGQNQVGASNFLSNTGFANTAPSTDAEWASFLAAF